MEGMETVVEGVPGGSIRSRVSRPMMMSMMARGRTWLEVRHKRSKDNININIKGCERIKEEEKEVEERVGQ